MNIDLNLYNIFIKVYEFKNNDKSKIIKLAFFVIKYIYVMYKK